jgi:hypothetical protein
VSGLHVGHLVTLFPGFYTLSGSIVIAGCKPPLVKPTRGAPSFINVPVSYNFSILSSMDAVTRREQNDPGPTARAQFRSTIQKFGHALNRADCSQ